MELQQTYQSVRARSKAICQGLQAEDFVVQPIVDVSIMKRQLPPDVVDLLTAIFFMPICAGNSPESAWLKRFNQLKIHSSC